MSTQDTQRSNILLEKKLSKGKDFSGQMRRVYKAFSERPKTMLQVALVKFGICPITKHRAGFYYTGKEVWNGK